jgi:hypothetical protein
LILGWISDVLKWIWNLPIKEKFWGYLEIAFFGNVRSYMKNSNQKRKAWRNMSAILEKRGDKRFDKAYKRSRDWDKKKK